MTRQTRAIRYEIAYEEVMRRIHNLHPSLLTPAENRVLQYLAYAIHVGSPDQSVSVLSQKVALSRRYLSKVLAKLQDKSLVIAISRMRTVRFNEINHYEIDFTGPLGESNMSLNMPKSASKSVAKHETGVCPTGQTYIINTNKEKQIHKCITRESRQYDNIETSVKEVAVRTHRKRAEKVAKATAPGSQLTFAGVKATWATAMLKHHATVPALCFSAKDFAIFKMRVQPILATCNLLEFFDFLVSSWTVLRRTKFAFINRHGKDIALAPSLPEVMHYWQTFAKAFLESRMIEANTASKLKPTEQDDADVAMRASKQKNAQLQRELATLKDRLAKAERIAYATRREEAPVLSLTAQRKKADDAYTPDDDIPDWSSHDQR